MSAAEPPPHFCPGCGAEQRPFPRYPWYFCNACCNRTEDRNGRRLVFTNEGIFGGFAWFYADDDTRWDTRLTSGICYIDRRRVVVVEARFGGVVAQPLAAGTGLSPEPRKGMVDFTLMSDEALQARLADVRDKR